MPQLPIEEMIAAAIPWAGLVFALVFGFKKMWGLKDRPAARVTFVLGPVLAVAWVTTQLWPDISVPLLSRAILVGLLASLGAMGVYKLGQWSPPEPQPPSEPPGP